MCGMGSDSEDAGRPRPTIYDVAEACGVAPSTVSRALSRPGRVNAETAERIREVAASLGYRTNPLARALPTGRTSLLAVIVADVTNPFFFEILRGAEETATEAGYTLLVADAQESDEAERRALDRTLPGAHQFGRERSRRRLRRRLRQHLRRRLLHTAADDRRRPVAPARHGRGGDRAA